MQAVSPRFFENVGPRREELEFGQGWAFMMRPLRFYGDESGAQGKGTYVIAGYLATAENWWHFKTDWLGKLAEPRQVQYFKRGPNYHGDVPFEGWPKAEREAKLSSMISVFERFGEALVEISSTMSWDTYRTVIVDGIEEIFPNPYYFCFHGVVSVVIDWIRQHKAANPTVETGAEFVFDQQDEHRVGVLRHYSSVYEQFPELAPMMLGCDFRDDKVTPGLQAADLIAWQIHRDVVRPPEDNDKERPELTALRSLFKHDGKQVRWNASRLASISTRNNSVTRLACLES
jgi:hypothetical protein